MLTPSKKIKLLNGLKTYKKQYLDRGLSDLDESGTRLMINHFLCEVLGYKPIEEIKTEYMIKGTYADYVIQLGGVRHFLVEVKALSLQLSTKHLRQTVDYGANEGIDWAILTNGKTLELHRIIFGKPIDSRVMFTVDLSDAASFKKAAELIQYLHRDAIQKKSLKALWNRCEALNKMTIAGMLYSKKITDELRKIIKARYNEKCTDEEISQALNSIMQDKIDLEKIKVFKSVKAERKPKTESKNIEVREEMVISDAAGEEPVIS
ncbi:type I restriction enzyme HsdR N-terminal domain-containing protein [Sediminibacterium ginsengisoli]|uniref:Type I restriction enzyme R protein N terminus (HSDR_N) n=1 Tax=Sediminibacterium ginsengisoli TaxID=413434 RepID=A0A1T4MLI7_9BACT|nr:type I restriction enzyme HsdR N-terminal domain-containing protein [Sediminibacterium ginsengisoli]SJZ67618.1 Type I restriction enzyme R protein N terminus (HSDR_N) [Sediminibacterium ginsengisoli]